MKAPPFTLADVEAARTSFVTQPRRVRFQDVDAAGTIYFARVFDLFGEAYVQLLEAASLDLPEILRSKKWAAPFAHAEADYRAPLFFGDAITVEIVRAHAGASSLTLGHRIRRADGKIAALGSTVHVFVDGATFKPIPVPEALRTFIDRAA